MNWNFRSLLIMTVLVFTVLAGPNSWARISKGEDETASFNQQIQEYLKKQSPLPTDKQEKLLSNPEGTYEALIVTRKSENAGELSYLFFRNKKNGETHLLEACPAYRRIENLSWRSAAELRFSCSITPQIVYDHAFNVQTLKFVSVQSIRD